MLIKKRATATLLAIVMIAGMFCTSVLGWESSEWSKEFITNAEEIGLIPESMLESNLVLPISRADFAAISVKLYENLTDTQTEIAEDSVNPFTDTDDIEVLKAYYLGITAGVAEDRFDPDATLTREQAATMLTRVFKKYSIPEWTLATDGDFTLDYEKPELFADDELISDWAKDSVYFMAANAIVLGMGENIFAPRPVSEEEGDIIGLVTCEQAITIALRVVDNIKAEETEEEATEVPESNPTNWDWDVSMSQNTYKLGDEDTYSDVKANCTILKFQIVLSSLAAKFDIAFDSDAIDEATETTRAIIIENLYTVICLALDIKEADIVNAADYFAENGLTDGKATEEQLAEICKVEEMIGLSVRVYEYLINKLDLDAKGFFWKVTGKENTVYLLGSIHISDGSLYPMNNEIEKAFAESENLAVEIDSAAITDADMQYYYEKGFITNGKTIKDYLQPEVYEVYAMICQTLGLPQSTYDYFQPWLIQNELYYMLIAMNEAESDDVAEASEKREEMAALGIDNYFMGKAEFGHKNVIQLESVRLQADMFASFSMELQEALLIQTLVEYLIAWGYMTVDEDDNITTASENLVDMLAVWKSGDEKIWSEQTGVDIEYTDALSIEYNYKMLTERNIGMTEQIIEFLETSEEDYFVVVGAAHMFGKDGLVQLLIDAGYTVERVK